MGVTTPGAKRSHGEWTEEGVMQGRTTMRSAVGTAAVVLAAFVGAVGLTNAQPAISPAFATVTVDGNPVASGMAASVLFDGTTFHMWYRSSAAPGLGVISHATSVDGVAYTTTGALTLSPDPFLGGTAPQLYYENASMIGGAAKLIHWTYYGGAGTFPAYDYNNSVSDVGATLGNLAITHQGPLGGGTIGQTAGSFGIVNGNWYGQCGNTGQDVCRSPYSDGNPPTVAPSIYPAVLLAGPLFTSLGISGGYINNHGDVIAGATGLDLFITVRTDSSGTRHDQQVYWAGSADDGLTWSAPSALFAAAPTLDGGSFGGNFAHPEAIWTGAQYFLYVSSQDLAGAYILAVAASPAPEPPRNVPVLSWIGLAGLAALLAALGLLAVRRA